MDTKSEKRLLEAIERRASRLAKLAGLQAPKSIIANEFRGILDSILCFAPDETTSILTEQMLKNARKTRMICTECGESEASPGDGLCTDCEKERNLEQDEFDEMMKREDFIDIVNPNRSMPDANPENN